MRFVVVGAGAVGGVVAGRLAGAGFDVVLVARGANLEAIRSDGLRVRSPEGSDVYRLPVAATAGEVDWRPGDMVLLAVKSMDTAGALSAIAAHAEPGTPVACVQNGVANEHAALRMFANVYGVCVMLPATHLVPGVVVANCAPTPGILDVGRYPGGVDGTAAELAAAFRAAGFHSEPRPDVMRWKYRKLLANTANAVEAVCGRVDGIDEIARLVRDEGSSVLTAAGIPYASEEEDRERRGDILRMRPVEGEQRQGGSSWQSLARGTGSVEADYLNGEVVLIGRAHGVPAPANELAQRLANQFAREGRAPGSLPVDEFRSLMTSPLR
ncbi:ketopantoate reductase family protein [Micromonospora sp. CPCC 206061]|uniref:ketopantoate reductase family protein n=1 Tax=Micromonospora sp. CPCC 206061 TaxID=3122410 RepID=UPI002FEE82BE